MTNKKEKIAKGKIKPQSACKIWKSKMEKPFNRKYIRAIVLLEIQLFY